MMRDPTAAAMPCCGGDDALLLCGEDAGELLELEQRDGDSGRQACCWADGGGFRELQLVPKEDDFPDVSVTWDAACSPAAGCPGRPRSDVDRPAGWVESVSWILKVRRHCLLRWLASAIANFNAFFLKKQTNSNELPSNFSLISLLLYA